MHVCYVVYNIYKSWLNDIESNIAKIIFYLFIKK